VFLGERGQGGNGIGFFHNSTNIEIWSARQVIFR
jgi:hypothetical protein